jgi:hypothetical protein
MLAYLFVRSPNNRLSSRVASVCKLWTACMLSNRDTVCRVSEISKFEAMNIRHGCDMAVSSLCPPPARPRVWAMTANIQSTAVLLRLSVRRVHRPSIRPSIRPALQPSTSKQAIKEGSNQGRKQGSKRGCCVWTAVAILLSTTATAKSPISLGQCSLC